MKREEARKVIAYLGDVAKEIKRATAAPIVIVLCMGESEGGSVLSASVGTSGPDELVRALRFAASKTHDEAADHVFEETADKRPAGKPS